MNIIQKAYAQEGLMAQPIFRYFENIEYYHNLTLIFLIMLFLISISFLITEYFIIYQPRFNFWHIFKKNRKEKSIKIEVLDTEGNPIKFALLTVMDKGGAVIERLYCNAQGKQKLGYSPKGTVTVEGFGCERVITELGEENNIQIIVSRVTDIALNPTPVKLRGFFWWLSIFILFLGIYLLFFSGDYLNSNIKLFILILSVINVLQILKNRKKAITITDHNGESVTDEVIISNEKGEKIKKIKPDNKGRIYSVFAPGFYKLSTENTIPKVIRIVNQEPNLKIKLN